MIEQNTSYAARALLRLIGQFKNKRTFEPILTALAVQVQALEDAYWQLLSDRTIDNAVGVQLDVLGAIVGEKRGGRPDPDYRLRIRARIRANLSNGTNEDIYAVFRALLATTPGYVLSYLPAYPAGFVFRINGVALSPALIYIYVRFLRDSKGAAIAAWFGWQEVQDSDAFVCGDSFGAPVVGKGFGDETDATAGGALVGVAPAI